MSVQLYLVCNSLYSYIYLLILCIPSYGLRLLQHQLRETLIYVCGFSLSTNLLIDDLIHIRDTPTNQTIDIFITR